MFSFKVRVSAQVNLELDQTNQQSSHCKTHNPGSFKIEAGNKRSKAPGS
jgi:hypothetical protein